MKYFTKFGILDNAPLLSGKDGAAGPPGLGFKLTFSGDYDIENWKLKNVENAEHLKDATNKTTAETLIRKNLDNVIKLDTNDSFNAENKHLKNIDHPIQNSDAIKMFEYDKLEERVKINPSEQNSLKK